MQINLIFIRLKGKLKWRDKGLILKLKMPVVDIEIERPVMSIQFKSSLLSLLRAENSFIWLLIFSVSNVDTFDFLINPLLDITAGPMRVILRVISKFLDFWLADRFLRLTLWLVAL